MTLSLSLMIPFRSIETTRPLFTSIGFASADGNVRSSPPVIIGAVSMKITSSSIITSMRLTTLISAFRCIRSRPRRRRTSDPAFAYQPRDDRRAKVFHHQIEAIQPMREDVVCERRWNRDGERRGRRDQRLRHARSDGGEIRRALGCDTEKRIDDAE